MVRALKYVLIALGMVHITVGPSNALQVLAWSKMLVDYSQGRTLAEAAGMTFDGDHPCSMCLALEESRIEEKKDPAPRPERSTERGELFPLREIRPQNGRKQTATAGPPSEQWLLADCKFLPELPTPPPRFV